MIAGWLLSLVGVYVWERRDTARPAPAIVVLGAAQYVGRPSPVLRARIDHAIDLWRRGLAPRIIFTGGFGDRDTTSEAAVGQRYAIEHGVPPRAILIENSGPLDGGIAAAGRARSWMPSRRATVILVSDPFHMLRLSILARRFGMTPTRRRRARVRSRTSWRESWKYALGESIKVPIAFLLRAARVAPADGARRYRRRARATTSTPRRRPPERRCGRRRERSAARLCARPRRTPRGPSAPE